MEVSYPDGVAKVTTAMGRADLFRHSKTKVGGGPNAAQWQCGRGMHAMSMARCPPAEPSASVRFAASVLCKCVLLVGYKQAVLGAACLPCLPLSAPMFCNQDRARRLVEYDSEDRQACLGTAQPRKSSIEIHGAPAAHGSMPSRRLGHE